MMSYVGVIIEVMVGGFIVGVVSIGLGLLWSYSDLLL